jgi:hypothetical protein
MGLGLESRDGGGISPLVPSIEAAAGLMDRGGVLSDTARSVSFIKDPINQALT